MISAQTVRDIAHLSRINLQEDEIARLTKDLERILGYVAKLQKLDTSPIAPTSHVLALTNVFREDIIKPSLPQESVMAMAIDQNKGFFKVPPVIE